MTGKGIMDDGSGENVHVKHEEMRPAATLAVRMIASLKSTAFAHNGMLSTRQGRERWKRLTCERDLLKFGKSIKSLEENLVWGAVKQDFDGMRKLCAELMPYEWSHMDEPMVWFEMVRAQARQGLSWFPASLPSTKSPQGVSRNS